MIQQFNQAGVRYLLPGGQAMRFMGMPRFSMDWDFSVLPHDQPRIVRINALLKEGLRLLLVPLGPESLNLIQTYQTGWGVLQFHLGVPRVPPFDEAENHAGVRHTETGTPVRCLSGPHLLAAKRAANRPEDQADLAFLTELQRLGKL